jgi:hypothetical protein
MISHPSRNTSNATRAHKTQANEVSISSGVFSGSVMGRTFPNIELKTHPALCELSAPSISEQDLTSDRISRVCLIAILRHLPFLNQKNYEPSRSDQKADENNFV